MALLDHSRSSALHRRRRPGIGVSLTQILQIWRSRRALRRLDADALADVGISPEAARAEAARPVWDVPHTWRLPER